MKESKTMSKTSIWSLINIRILKMIS